MNEPNYGIVSSWRSALKDLPQRRPSATISGLFAPAVFWLLSGLFTRPSLAGLLKSGIPLVFLMVLALASYIVLRNYRNRRRRDATSTRLTALVNIMFAGPFLVVISAYSLQLALALTALEPPLPPVVSISIVGLYLFSAFAAILWCPWSLPRSKLDDELATTRQFKWLPWLIGTQASLVGLGVFLGAWLMHEEYSWESLLWAGLGTLCAVLTVTFGILFLYRFIVLALHPIPQEIREEFGLRD